MKRVVFAGGGTGGHLYPALNLAAALRALRSDVETHFVGAKRGIEARVLPEKGVPHMLLPLEPLRRDRVWQNWRLLLSLLGTLRGLRVMEKRLRPDLVVGTGGYASGPVGLWAWLRGIPLALQEQNSFPGLTTRWLSRRARQVHLGFPEAEQYLQPGPDTEVFALGNPIRAPEPVDRTEARRSFGLSEDATVLLVVGGSQGARAINGALLEAVNRVASGALERPAGLEILWSTGPTHEPHVREWLDVRLGSWVHAVGYIERMADALGAADMAVSRAGAMATAELAAWGVPAILVPLPTAAADHQRQNAEALAAAGAAAQLPESELTPDRLWSQVVALVGDADARATMARKARDRARPDAAAAIAEHLSRLIDA